jgi:hypothetical protein
MLPVKRVIASASFSWPLAACASALRLSRSASIFRSSAVFRLPGCGGTTVGPFRPALVRSSDTPMTCSFALGCA